MRKTLKVIGIALATILVICIVNNRKQILSYIPTDFSKVEMIYDNRTDDDMNVRYYYNHLSDNAKIAYTLIVPEVYKHTELIEIPKITDSEFTA